MFPNGLLEPLLQLGVAGVFIIYLWRQVHRLEKKVVKLEAALERERKLNKSTRVLVLKQNGLEEGDFIRDLEL